MSNTKLLTKHPETKQFELATWIDNHFGEHNYGIIFDSSPNVIHDSRDEEFETKENKTAWEIRLDNEEQNRNINAYSKEDWDKIKDFIRTLLAEQREGIAEEITLIDEIYQDHDTTRVWNGLKNKVLQIIKSYETTI